MNASPLRRLPRLAAILAAGCVAAACASPPAGPGAAAVHSARTAAPGRPAASDVAAPVTAGVVLSRIRAPDGSVIISATFRGPVRYVLHNGSQDPGPAAGRAVSAGPVIAGTARRHLLAAFNGGFKLAARAGGYEQEGHVVSPIRRGLASLVIDRSGRARIGVWGDGVPARGEAVWSVRQNLWPLLADGRPTAESARWWRWGGTVGHAEYAARSALGQDAAGQLSYAAGMHTTPADLAYALARGGAVIAMELDINSEWVQLDTAREPGGRLTAAIPGQVRPARQYLAGWTRDFVAVEAPSAPAGHAGAGRARSR